MQIDASTHPLKYIQNHNIIMPHVNCLSNLYFISWYLYTLSNSFIRQTFFSDGTESSSCQPPTILLVRRFIKVGALTGTISIIKDLANMSISHQEVVMGIYYMMFDITTCFKTICQWSQKQVIYLYISNRLLYALYVYNALHGQKYFWQVFVRSKITQISTAHKS